MSWKSVGNWQQRRTADLSELKWYWPVSSKQGNYPDEEPPKHYTATGTRLQWAGTSPVLFGKRGNIPNESVSQLGSKSNKRHITSLDLMAKVIRPETRRRTASEQQINRLHGLLSVQVISQQPTDHNHKTQSQSQRLQYYDDSLL